MKSAEIADSEAFATRFAVSRETVDRLRVYEATLRRWQSAINLVAPATLSSIWHRHFADSAQLAALMPDGARALADLGSGGGFPGLVLAIILSDKGLSRVVLVESDARKAAFLREVARLTSAPVEILSTRIENRQTQSTIGAVDVVTARALAPLSRLIGLAAPLFGPKTVGLFPKGREAQSEVQAARVEWSFECSLVPSVTEPAANIVVIRRLEADQAQIEED
ncbi:MAG: 16S rRNA (guanine(527)-N(7))-methyltransferase RsmG [Hyphomicrobiaceae bacterium]